MQYSNINCYSRVTNTDDLHDIQEIFKIWQIISRRELQLQ